MNKQFTIGFSIALVLGLVGGSLLTRYAADALPISNGGGAWGRVAMQRADLRTTSLTQPASRGNSVATDNTPLRRGRGNGLGAGLGHGRAAEIGAGRGCGGGGCSESAGAPASRRGAAAVAAEGIAVRPPVGRGVVVPAAAAVAVSAVNPRERPASRRARRRLQWRGLRSCHRLGAG